LISIAIPRRRLGISPRQIDSTLYDAYGQRQVSTIYSAINQYHVVMEIDPRYTQFADSLRDVYVATSAATPPGTAVTNAPGGTVTAATTVGTTARPMTAPASATVTASTTSARRRQRALPRRRPRNANAARNAATNALANTGTAPHRPVPP